MIVWSIANQKGGVGKTTTTITLAGLLSKQGKRVLLVDTDPHASLTTYLGYDSDGVASSLFDLFQLKEFSEQSVLPLVMKSDIEGIDLIPAHMSLATLDRVMGNRSGMGLILKRALMAIKEHYDYVLIDCPADFRGHDGQCVGCEQPHIDSSPDGVLGDEGLGAHGAYIGDYAKIS